MTQENDPTLAPAVEPVVDSGKSEKIVARAGRYYRNTRYLMFILIVAFGAWCIYDGWVNWPKENVILQQAVDAQKTADETQNQAEIDRIAAIRAKYKHHTEMDLNIQKGLGLLLPPLAVLLLIRALYISRGEYRLEGRVLHAPGHPPIPLERVTKVDRRLWDRKGILYFEYQLPDGKGGRVKLDDFVYDRKGADAIAEQIKERG